MILPLFHNLVIFFFLNSKFIFSIDVGSLSIKSTHPRLILTDSITTRYSSKLGKPSGDKFIELANGLITSSGYDSAMFIGSAYALTKDVKYLTKAKSELASIVSDLDSSSSYTGSNQYRWSGANVPILFDWLYDELTPTERSNYISSMDTWTNYYMNNFQRREDSDDFASVLRNAILNSLAIWGHPGGENAPTYLDHALNTLWEGTYDFKNWLIKGLCAGGIWAEGIDYSGGTPGYVYTFNQAMITATGVDLLADSLSFVENHAKSIIYQTLPFDYSDTSKDHPYFYPHYDIEEGSDYYNGNSVRYTTLLYRILGELDGKGNKMTEYVVKFHDEIYPNLEVYTNYMHEMWKFFYYPTSDEKVSSDYRDHFSLDYFSNGVNFLLSRSSWDFDATFIGYQIGTAWQLDHMQSDAISFQIYRKNVAVTTECSTYGSMDSIFHNTLILENYEEFHGGAGANPRNTQNPRGFDKDHNVKIVSQPVLIDDFLSVAKTDVTGIYNAYDYLPDKSAENIYEIYMYLRPNTILQYDYVKTKDSYDIRWSRKIVHTPISPTILSNSEFKWTIDTQEAKVISVIPFDASSSIFNVVDETSLFSGLSDWELAFNQRKYHVQINPITEKREQEFFQVITVNDIGEEMKVDVITQNSNYFHVEITNGNDIYEVVIPRVSYVFQKSEIESISPRATTGKLVFYGLSIGVEYCLTVNSSSICRIPNPNGGVAVYHLDECPECVDNYAWVIPLSISLTVVCFIVLIFTIVIVVICIKSKKKPEALSNITLDMDNMSNVLITSQIEDKSKFEI